MSGLVRIGRSRPFQVYKAGEVLRAELRGDPVLSVWDSASCGGALVVLSRAQLERDFATVQDAITREFEAPASLEIKLLCAEADVSKARSAASKAGLSISKYATFPDNSSQEVLLYVGSGRLRAAPLDTPSAPEKPVLAKPAPVPQPKLRTEKIRVLIVDDSKTIRQMLKSILSRDPRLEVVGEAEKPSQVEPLIHEKRPDVMTLDINMPEMTGVELLKILLPKTFVPTVMISALGLHEGVEVMMALEYGAVDYIQKPAAGEIATAAPLIIEKIVEAANVRRHTAQAHEVKARSKVIARLGSSFGGARLLAVGASTGGTEAIKKVFTSFTKDVPPIVVVQHIPPYFSMAFANRLNELCEFEVREAKDGDELHPGLALVAPGGLHMEVVTRGASMYARVFDAEPVNRFKPSVDVLFRSVAKELGSKAAGVLLTGMGNDGAKGLLEMRHSGAHTIAQDEESCVVFGMPRAAIELGAACDIKALDDIADALYALKKVA